MVEEPVSLERAWIGVSAISTSYVIFSRPSVLCPLFSAAMHDSSAAPFPSFLWGVGSLFLFLVVGGCGGGNTYSFDEGRVAQRFLPTERSVDTHPDSLEALTIKEEEGKVQYELERDYESLIRKWSSSFQSVGAGRSHRGMSYATFWSLEVSLASLQPEMGVLTLRKEKAYEMIERRKEEYSKTIQIDVYWFEGGNALLTGPNARTELQVADSTYRPEREEHSPLREAFLGGGGTALYRRNTFYFSRIVDGRDILEDVQGMQLEIRRTGGGTSQRFAWSWGDTMSAQQNEEGDPGSRHR